MLFRLLIASLFLWMSVSIAGAQDYPVEIEMIPPDEVTEVVEVLPLENPASQPDWQPPAQPCTLCGSLPGPNGCDCGTPLTQAMAQQLYGEVESALHNVSGGLLDLHKPVQVRAISRNRLTQIGGERLLGLYQDDTIWLSYDLDRRRAYAVLAHEYGHAWFFQKRADVNSPNELLFEGFAEFVSYLAVLEVGDRQSLRRIVQLDDSIYGRGARKLLEVYRRSGLAAVLELALRANGV